MKANFQAPFIGKSKIILYIRFLGENVKFEDLLTNYQRKTVFGSFYKR